MIEHQIIVIYQHIEVGFYAIHIFIDYLPFKTFEAMAPIKVTIHECLSNVPISSQSPIQIAVELWDPD